MTGTAGISMLPPLGPDESRQTTEVLQAVQTRLLEKGGWIPFDEYLRLVLYAPGLGYYSAGSVKFGREGDFVTAPELSPLFGRALARQCAQVLERLGGGSVLELGAGSGALAESMLPVLDQLQVLPEHYEILETSADLVARQRARLARLPDKVRDRIRWLDRLPEAPMSGVILANEVADAMPFRRFLVTGQGLLERGIGFSANAQLTQADRPADDALAAELERIRTAPWSVGYESELCLLLDGWIAALRAALGRGLVLLVDYGLARHEYYHPQRTHGTLRCYFRHRAHDDALLYPGLQDISAWVDFTRAAEAAVDSGLELSGYCTQAAFLLANGIEADVAAARSTLERARSSLARRASCCYRGRWVRAARRSR